MGWATGQNSEGREVGYGVEAECDQWLCEERIDRGLAYVCGGMHDGGDHGCGKYFCGDHLMMGSAPTFLCGSCCSTFEQRIAFRAGWLAGKAGKTEYVDIAYDEWHWSDDDDCDGGYRCRAKEHLGGCYADDSQSI